MTLLRYSLGLALLFFLVCCGPDAPTPNTTLRTDFPAEEWHVEIDTLTNKRLQRQYLESMRRVDEALRRNEGEMRQRYGYDSKQHRNIVNRMAMLDSTHLEKIQYFLHTKGHPTMKAHGSLATYTPMLIVEHTNARFDKGAAYFPTFYQAYRAGDLNAAVMGQFLSQLYQDRFGEHYQISGTYKEEDRIETMIPLLGLQRPAPAQ